MYSVERFFPPVHRYLDNILSHPGEEKYTKIPTQNKTFREKVQSVHGATLFLEATGFQQQLLPHKGGVTLQCVIGSACIGTAVV